MLTMPWKELVVATVWLYFGSGFPGQARRFWQAWRSAPKRSIPLLVFTVGFSALWHSVPALVVWGAWGAVEAFSAPSIDQLPFATDAPTAQPCYRATGC